MAGTLTSHEVFGFLLPEQVHAISEAAERVSFKAGENIYEKGDKADYFFIILDGEVTLRLPTSPGGLSLVVDHMGKGAIFGGPLGQKRKGYCLSAQGAQRGKLLKIEISVMKKLMEKDMRMGLSLQRYVASAYFDRYIDTMKKLQAIVMNIPVEA
jgi:signal-transduction protein with cAMP-binding, CBS, and nucleotidyltransferase domain